MSPVDAVEKIAAAMAAQQEGAYRAALGELTEAVETAQPDDLPPAMERLAAVLADAALGAAADLARAVGSIAWLADDPSAVLGVLVERACGALELAATFRDLHRELLGDPPAHDDFAAVQRTLRRFIPAARGRAEDPLALAQAWFTGSGWAQPVLLLAQRADVRAALPDLARLLGAVESTRDDFDIAHLLHELLFVLDDAPLLVLHRETGRGYRMTIGGIGDNFQLHTLLAARLVGDPDDGWLPGTPPAPLMVAAADGSGPIEPRGGLKGVFNLVDPYGDWIWNEGRPADIPLFDGARVVILDPPAYERRWQAGRAFPLMRPTCVVTATMSPQEADAWLAKARPAGPRRPPPRLRQPGLTRTRTGPTRTDPHPDRAACRCWRASQWMRAGPARRSREAQDAGRSQSRRRAPRTAVCRTKRSGGDVGSYRVSWWTRASR